MNQFARPGLAVTELPPVNADDNGKVLGVSDGAWAKVAASGGSDLPDDPAQDGTYNLQNTVSSGTGTLSWASGSSGGGVLVVNINEEYTTLDKTWQEIHDALAQGIRCVTVFTEDNDVEQGQIVSVSAGAGKYYVYVLSSQVTTPFVVQWTATSADGYPTNA